MARLTREESKARTRTTLVDTARDLFLRDGYGSTSLEKVADEAGFSKGAVYSNFRNKEELCLAVLDAIHQREFDALGAAFDADADLETKLGMLGAWAESVLGTESWTMLGVEALAAAHGSADLRGQLAERDAALCALLAGLVRREVEAGTVDPVLPPDQLAPALLGVGIGLGLQRAVRPELEASLLVDTARALLRPVDG